MTIIEKQGVTIRQASCSLHPEIARRSPMDLQPITTCNAFAMPVFLISIAQNLPAECTIRQYR
jgi:hypothetical protein